MLTEETETPEWIANIPESQDEAVKQLFVVDAMSMETTTASVYLFERDEAGTWQQIMSTPGFVGKNGLCADADHKEGCGQTPVGTYKFNKAFGIAADPGCAIPSRIPTEIPIPNRKTEPLSLPTAMSLT